MKYLTVEQVVKIHDELILQFGGMHGLRSPELLESAVFRMQVTFGGQYLYKNIFEQAAALLESLCKNHPFVDGNKRAAFVTAATFLEMNGCKTNFKKENAETFILEIAAGKKSFEEIVKFLRKKSKKR